MLLNSLGRVLVASGLVAVTSFMASTAAVAAPATATTGAITITGTVASIIAIAVTPPTFPILQGQTLETSKVEVTGANLTFGTNNSTGLTVTASGDTLLKEAAADGPGPDVLFTLGFGHAFSTPATATYGAFNSGGPESSTASQKLYIQYKSAAVQDPGAYTASVTLTAVDN